MQHEALHVDQEEGLGGNKQHARAHDEKRKRKARGGRASESGEDEVARLELAQADLPGSFMLAA
jgi:hypothetical protein